MKGPLLVLAGAGTGKTSLLVHKIAWLIREYGVDPAHILALTANAHTAKVISSGVSAILGRRLSALTICTHDQHSLRIIQQYPQAFGLRPGFSLYDRAESEAIVARLLNENAPQALTLTQDTWRCLEAWKRDLVVPPPPTGELSPLSARELAAWLHSRYEQRLRAANAVDMADLARNTVQLLAGAEPLLTEWRNRIRFLLVDEYEQTSAAEQEIVRLLAVHRIPLTAAADDSAGSAPEKDSSAHLQTAVPDLRVIRLERNFRSTARILKTANALHSGAAPTAVANGVPQGAPVRVLQTRTEQHVAEAVVQTLIDQKSQLGDEYRHYALLLRHPSQAGPIERALQARGIPYHSRTNPLLQQPEVRDFWAYLTLVCNPADDHAFLRALNTPRRNIAHGTVELLRRFSVERGSSLFEAVFDAGLGDLLPREQLDALRGVADLLRAMIERIEYVDPVQLASDLLAELRYEEWLRDTCNDFNIAARRMDNVMQLIRALSRLARSSADANLRHVVTQLNVDAVLGTAEDDAAIEGVTLMALADARGMEFRHVYLVGLEDALLSGTRREGQAHAWRERRLAHLGATRARETLTVAIAEYHRGPGMPAPQRGGLLSELPLQDLEWVEARPARGLVETVLAPNVLHWDKSTLPPR